MENIIAWLLIPLELFIAVLIITGICSFVYDTWEEIKEMLHDTGKY